MPDKKLSKSVTKGLFTGRFWVDGVTSIATDSNGEQYLWIYSTVHSPQLPSGSKLAWFAQLGQVTRKEEDERLRQLQQQTIVSAFNITTDVSSFICKVTYKYDADNIESVSESKFTIQDFDGPDVVDWKTEPDKSLDQQLVKLVINGAGSLGSSGAKPPIYKNYIHSDVEDAKAYEGEYKYWGNDAANNSIKTFETFGDSQFINTCAMWRKLEISDLDYGKGGHTLKPDDIVLANFGYEAELFDDTGSSFFIHKNVIIEISLQQDAALAGVSQGNLLAVLTASLAVMMFTFF